MSTDSTVVTGGPAGLGGLRRGDVLAERYEVLEAVDAHGPTFGYRALDQETERPVLVRVLSGPGLDRATLDDVVARLRGLIGVGGRYLSPILDADREKRSPFTVEAWPSGTMLMSVLESRETKGRLLDAGEVLPVVARLGAALAALPAGWHHGDVRAPHVWVAPDGLRLTGAFLLSALPPALVADLLADHENVLAAPERREGRGGPASDRWGVAAIAWRALTGAFPQDELRHAAIDPSLRAAFERALDPDPSRRPASLEPLLAALAARAGLVVPALDPEPHRPPTADLTPPGSAARVPRKIDGAAAEGTQEISFDQILEARPAPRKIEGAAAEGTQEIAFDQILEESTPGADDTARHSSVQVPADDSLDPRLVRAALGIVAEPSAEHSADSLDPRLVRAALGVESDSIEEIADEPARPAPKPRPASSGPPGPRPASVPAPMPAPKPRPLPEAVPMAAPKPRALAEPAPAPRPRPLPEASPAPKPRPLPEAAPAPKPRPLPEAAPKPRPSPEAAAAAPAPKPRPLPEAAPAPTPKPRPSSEAAPRSVPAPQPRPLPEAAPAPRPQPAARGSDPPRGTSGGTAVVARDRITAPPVKRKSRAGLVIVIAAVFVALGIVAAGFAIAHQRQAERTRSREIQERLLQLQQQGR